MGSTVGRSADLLAGVAQISWVARRGERVLRLLTLRLRSMSGPRRSWVDVEEVEEVEMALSCLWSRRLWWPGLRKGPRQEGSDIV